MQFHKGKPTHPTPSEKQSLGRGNKVGEQKQPILNNLVSMKQKRKNKTRLNIYSKKEYMQKMCSLH